MRTVLKLPHYCAGSSESMSGIAYRLVMVE